jgi:steroid Delta-isomerase
MPTEEEQMAEQPSPAQVARAAMAAVETGQREAWLGLFADDTRVEDPVGHLPPMVGRAALAQFWDGAIAPLTAARFDVTREWETSEEAMLLATVSIATASGNSTSYDGAFNYTIDSNFTISSLRAFWDLPAVAAALGV